MSTHDADIIDLLAGIAPGSPLSRLRDHRAQARENAQRSFRALLEPADPGTLPLSERYAIAAFTARLHGFERGAAFYLDLLEDEAPEIAGPLAQATDAATGTGPYGAYREPGLAAESVAGPTWAPGDAIAASLGTRLTAALSHAHLLVLRPRESSADALRALVAAGYSADDIVRLSQLVAFLTFQLRTAWGLQVLQGGDAHAARDAHAAADADAARDADAAGEPVAPHPGGTGARASFPATQLVTDHPDLDRPDRFTQQSLGWAPWLAPVAKNDLTEAQREALIDDTRAQMPYFRLLARDPEALHARTLTDLDIFYNTDGGVGRAERELAATATSRRNGCVFCASVHAASATRESGREADVQRLLDAGTDADLGDERWNAVVAASVSLAATPLAFGGADTDRLRGAGFDDAAIVDLIGAAAFFNWANRLMLSLGEPEIPTRKAKA